MAMSAMMRTMMPRQGAAAEAAGVGCSVAFAPEAAGAPGAATSALALLVFGEGSVLAFFGDFGFLSPLSTIGSTLGVKNSYGAKTAAKEGSWMAVGGMA